MLSAGRWRSFGEQFAAGGQGAQNVYGGYGEQEMNLAKLAQEQQATRLANIKANVDLLNSAIAMRRVQMGTNLPSGLDATTPAGPGPSTTLAPFFAKDLPQGESPTEDQIVAVATHIAGPGMGRSQDNSKRDLEPDASNRAGIGNRQSDWRRGRARHARCW
jgi:hypothetical protein